ncbi:hypothetical protein [Nocardioides bruguierae]|uniref:Uncharacterized protein n=1 Tax=Nocardioides bruguierae TaxID=2945102 RepID=A0A9X2IHH1_9ACTN|nr:hypothetical protein [Nocardioides bruguierae]MCM0621790.1 hypothetical protein [Nocardioides bruguierae]
MHDNRPTNSGSSSDLTPMEELLVMKVGLIAAGVVASSVCTVAFWHRILDWLVEHQVLVEASNSPIVKMPSGQGVGLDVPRVAIAVAALVALVVFGIAALRAYWSRPAEHVGGLGERRMR